MISCGVVMTVYLGLQVSSSKGVWYFYLQLDDMRMSQQLQVLNFSLHSASHIPRYEFLTRYDFQSNFLSTDAMYCEFDFAERAFAQGLLNAVLSNSLTSTSLCGQVLAVASGLLLWRSSSLSGS